MPLVDRPSSPLPESIQSSSLSQSRGSHTLTKLEASGQTKPVSPIQLHKHQTSMQSSCSKTSTVTPKSGSPRQTGKRPIGAGHNDARLPLKKRICYDLADEQSDSLNSTSVSIEENTKTSGATAGQLKTGSMAKAGSKFQSKAQPSYYLPSFFVLRLISHAELFKPRESTFRDIAYSTRLNFNELNSYLSEGSQSQLGRLHRSLQEEVHGERVPNNVRVDAMLSLYKLIRGMHYVAKAAEVERSEFKGTRGRQSNASTREHATTTMETLLNKMTRLRFEQGKTLKSLTQFVESLHKTAKQHRASYTAGVNEYLGPPRAFALQVSAPAHRNHGRYSNQHIAHENRRAQCQKNQHMAVQENAGVAVGRNRVDRYRSEDYYGPVQHQIVPFNADQVSTKQDEQAIVTTTDQHPDPTPVIDWKSVQEALRFLNQQKSTQQEGESSIESPVTNAASSDGYDFEFTGKTLKVFDSRTKKILSFPKEDLLGFKYYLDEHHNNVLRWTPERLDPLPIESNRIDICRRKSDGTESYKVVFLRDKQSVERFKDFICDSVITKRN